MKFPSRAQEVPAVYILRVKNDFHNVEKVTKNITKFTMWKK